MQINNVPSNVLDRVLVNGGGTLRTTYLDPNRPNEPVWTDEDMPTTGYYVGVYNIAVIDNLTIPNALREELNDLTAPSGFDADTHYLGFWRNPDNGTWYIDISRRFTDLTIAMTDAAELGELAIWDIANNRAIDLR